MALSNLSEWFGSACRASGKIEETQHDYDADPQCWKEVSGWN